MQRRNSTISTLAGQSALPPPSLAVVAVIPLDNACITARTVAVALDCYRTLVKLRGF